LGDAIPDYIELSQRAGAGGPHWLDEPSILAERAKLQQLGYLPGIRFNHVIDAALARIGLGRSDIYVTQTFHLIPRTRSELIEPSAISRSFDEVTRFELQGRKVIALGAAAGRECARHNINHTAVCHPSRRGHTNEKNAVEIASAIAALGFGGADGKIEAQKAVIGFAE
jgi:hypothetical protein